MDVYNDFQRMVRSDNIDLVIEKYHLLKGRDCADYRNNQSLIAMQEVMSAMRAVSRKAYPALIKLCSICVSLTVSQLALFLHITAGNPLISFAKSEGISEQAAHQMWCRIVRKNPDLANIRKRRRKYEYKRTSSSSHPTHAVLGEREGKSGGMR